MGRLIGRSRRTVIIEKFNNYVQRMDVIVILHVALSGYMHSFCATVSIQDTFRKSLLNRLSIMRKKSVTPGHNGLQGSIPTFLQCSARQEIDAAGIAPQMFDGVTIHVFEAFVEMGIS